MANNNFLFDAPVEPKEKEGSESFIDRKASALPTADSSHVWIIVPENVNMAKKYAHKVVDSVSTLLFAAEQQ